MSARFMLVAAAAVGLAGSASAQYMPRFGPQIPSGVYYNSPMGGFYFNSYQTYQFSYTATVFGQPVNIRYQYAWSGWPPPGSYAQPYSPQPYKSMSGFSGFNGGDRYNPIVEQQRSAIARAQRASEWDTRVAGKKDDVDNWVAAQGRVDQPAAPALDPSLIDPSDESILSGKALNELLALIVPKDKAGKKVEAGLCPPELLETVTFEGGDAAAALNLFRQPAVPYPAVVVVPETAKLRTAIDTEFTAIRQAIRAGKKPPAMNVDRFDAALAAARKALDERLKDAPFAESKAVNELLTHLEAAARFARDPKAATVLPVSWHTTGATVAELVRHMDKFKLRFDAAPVGGEPAYLSLHRGLLGFYARLMTAK